MLEATAEANNLTAQAAAIDKYNKEMEEVSTCCIAIYMYMSTYSFHLLFVLFLMLVVWC